jgi:3-oxoacyl-[acyl-carrier protein] reductase
MTNTVLKGKVAIITGAASGLGKALSKKLLYSGAHVILVDKNEIALSETLAELEGTFEGHVADVRDLAGIEKIITDVAQKTAHLIIFLT